MSKTEELFKIVSQLVAYHERDWDTLRRESDQIAQWEPELVAAFYDTLYGVKNTAAVFQPGERPKLERTLQEWIGSMISGRKGVEFWDHQWFIALMHVQRGVKNLYMLSMMNRVQQVFLEKCMATYSKEKAFEVFNAFLRLSGVISALIAECYGVVLENSTSEGLAKVGVKPALLERIKSMQIKKMLEEVHH